MDVRTDRTGIVGVGYLFGLIALVILILGLKETGYATLAAEIGIGGSALLAGFAGRYLFRKWRTASDAYAFDRDGNVAFSGAVFLLASLFPVASIARLTGVDLSKGAPLLCILLVTAAIPARKFAEKLRRSR